MVHIRDNGRLYIQETQCLEDASQDSTVEMNLKQVNTSPTNFHFPT